MVRYSTELMILLISGARPQVYLWILFGAGQTMSGNIRASLFKAVNVARVLRSLHLQVPELVLKLLNFMGWAKPFPRQYLEIIPSHCVNRVLSASLNNRIPPWFINTDANYASLLGPEIE